MSGHRGFGFSERAFAHKFIAAVNVTLLKSN